MKKFDIRNQVVIMCGISGAGKTHFALDLVKDGFIRLSTDVLIWEKVGDKLSSLSIEERKKLFAECREEVFTQLNNLIETGSKVVIDATNCKRIVRDKIRELCVNKGVSPIFVYCFADKEELKHRLSQRKGTGPDDLVVTEEEFQNYWLGFERPLEDESDIIYYKTDY